MALILKPPQMIAHLPSQPSVFLAGSIDMGSAEDWQQEVSTRLAVYDLTILNPRRDDWDATWIQAIDNPQFRAQVEWELEALERADLILMYFAPTSQAPITLLELGLFARSGRVVVCCPAPFWRKGNVDVVCARYGISQVANLAELCSYAEEWLLRR